MLATLHTPLSVEKAIERIKCELTEDGFIFSEEDVSHIVQYKNGNAQTAKVFSRFWSRKDLNDKYPAYYAITIEGTIRKEEETSCVIEIEMAEYHYCRKHSYGGTKAVDDYFHRFCSIFEHTIADKPNR